MREAAKTLTKDTNNIKRAVSPSYSLTFAGTDFDSEQLH
jgi:hypothetical protein